MSDKKKETQGAAENQKLSTKEKCSSDCQICAVFCLCGNYSDSNIHPVL